MTRERTEQMLRSWVFRLHLWLGAFAGAFFVILGVTGSILAFESPLDRMVNANLSYVAASGQTLSLHEIISSIKKSFPADEVFPQFLSGLMMWWKRGKARRRAKMRFLVEGGAR
jgi:uncharacterized iron-regulated membrane protein